MDKSKFVSFLSKYTLGGVIQSVKLETEGGALCTKFMADDNTLMGDVRLKNFPVSVPEIGIYNTETFSKMVSVLGNDINVHVAEENPTSIVLDDGSTTVDFRLSDMEVIPKVKVTPKDMVYNLTINITKELIDKFNKAKAAFGPDARNFTVAKNKKTGKYQILLGTTKSNNISLELSYEDIMNDIAPISFSSDYFKEILSANRESTGTMKIFARPSDNGKTATGITKIEFESDDFATTYHITSFIMDVE